MSTKNTRIQQGHQFKFFNSKQVYVMIAYQRYRRYSHKYASRDDRQSYLLTAEEEKNIRSVYDPVLNRQIAKRKKKGEILEWFYNK